MNKNVNDTTEEKERVVFIFWIGKQNSIEKLLAQLRKYNFKIVLGPSSEDHNYLMKNYAYYRMAYEQQIWAFCSDVWRLYKLSEHKGMYIDASTEIGDNIREFYDKNILYDVSLFKETQTILANCVLFSGEKGNSFYKSLLELYNIGYVDELPLRIYPIAPVVLSSYVFKKYFNFYGFTENTFSSSELTIKINTLCDIRNKTTIYKSGFGSWWNSKKYFENASKSKSHWDELENRWNNLIESHEYDRQIEMANTNENIPIWIRSLLSAYVNSTSKKQRKNLNDKYLSIKYKIKFSEFLIWAKINRIFFKKNKH